MHKRTEIRNALVSTLTGTDPSFATDAGSDVFRNRPQNFTPEQLPAINILDGPENAIPRDMAKTSFIRTWVIKIQIKIEANADFDIALDTIANQIEAAINLNRSLGGNAQSAVYISTEEPTFDSSAAKVIGDTTLNYEIKYVS